MDDKNLTTGSLWKKMFWFSVPLILMNLLQAVYNIVDMMIVGKYVGAAGLSAVSIGGQITAVVLCIVLGLADSGAVVVAQLIGGNKKEKIKDVVSTMFGLFTGLAIIFTVLVCVFAEPLLMLLNTPEESFVYACTYLRICMIGTIFVYLYNLMSGVFRGMGNSLIPMCMVLVSSCVNVLLDLYFIKGLALGSDGAAFATVISQGLSMIVLLVIAKHKKVIEGNLLQTFLIKRESLKVLLRIGVPQSIEFAVTNVSFLFLVGMINIYGVYASAAAGAASKISTFAVLTAQAMLSAVITMAAQNIGGKKPERARKGAFVGMCYALPIPIIFAILSWTVPEKMLSLFSTEMAVLSVGAPYLQVIAISFLVESVLFCLMGIVAGAGYTNYTLLCTLVDAVAIRIPVAKLLSTTVGLGFIGIAWAYPCAPAVALVLIILFLASGKWKQCRIHL